MCGLWWLISQWLQGWTTIQVSAWPPAWCFGPKLMAACHQALTAAPQSPSWKWMTLGGFVPRIGENQSSNLGVESSFFRTIPESQLLILTPFILPSISFLFVDCNHIIIYNSIYTPVYLMVNILPSTNCFDSFGSWQGASETASANEDSKLTDETRHKKSRFLCASPETRGEMGSLQAAFFGI